jgi:hypothetical protein
VRRVPWVVHEFVFPLTPFLLELFVRAAVLRHHLSWWKVPNVETLLITLALFSLFLRRIVAQSSHIQGDDEFLIVRGQVVDRFGYYAVGCGFLFAVSVFSHAADTLSHGVFEDLVSFPLFIAAAGMFVLTSFEALTSGSKYLKTP